LREQEFRKADAARDDNPRVEMITTKGRIVIELFENQAPESVNSFIYLVEKKFHDNKKLFRVETHTCAQAGCEKGDGTSNAGYVIASESSLPERRDHYRGSLGLALGFSKQTNRPELDSGGSQFYFSFIPMPSLDGDYTVFGRVVEGLPALGSFRVMNLADPEQRKDTKKKPDSIHSIRVIRKRDHDYIPSIVSGKLLK
jgi:cyclophilin family peptidyl-prolyl cis-trans isomerase